MKKSCGECGNLRNNGCKRPDHCVAHGYCDWTQGRVRPWETCQTCGAKLSPVRTEWPIDTLRNRDLVCPECGERWVESRSVDRKRKAPA